MSFLGDFFELLSFKKGEKVNPDLLTPAVNQGRKRWKQTYMVQQSDAQQNLREPQDNQKTTQLNTRDSFIQRKKNQNPFINFRINSLNFMTDLQPDEMTH